jgi:hypothetical protein
LSQSDPTDSALAAIASILDQPDSHRGPEKFTFEDTPPEGKSPEDKPVEDKSAEDSPADPQPIEPAGYSRIGPGPIAAIRFKWTVREDHGAYYVDETIGEDSTPVVSGPMTRDAAIKLVDDRENEAQLRFEQIKSEMTGRAAAANLVRRDSGES